MKTRRPTKAIVDLGAIRKNVKEAINRVYPAILMAVVKANAYGHGMLECARAAKEAGASYLAVATVDEALELRKHFPFPFPILILGPIFRKDADVVVRNDIEIAMGSLEVARRLDKAAVKYNKSARIHLKIDTGMGRFGFWSDELLKAINALQDLKNLQIAGTMTHFSESDSRDFTYTKWQIENFNRALAMLKSNNIDPGLIHAANSGAIHQHPKAYFDMVRLGVSLYGYYPSNECVEKMKLAPALSLVTKIVKIRTHPEGRFISYGRTFQTKRKSVIGILPIGYADGFIRRNSNNGYVLVRGKKAALIGRVCMDQTMIDLTDIPEAKEGDDVTLIGTQGNESITMEDFAEKIGTITYEVTCLLTKRIPREYIN